MPVRIIRDRLHSALFQLLISLLQYFAYYIRRLSLALESLVEIQLNPQTANNNMSGQITIVQNPISPTLRLKLRKGPKHPPGPENSQPITIDSETLTGLLKIADKNGNVKVNITANGHITNGAEPKPLEFPSVPPRKKNRKRGKKGGKQIKSEANNSPTEPTLFSEPVQLIFQPTIKQEFLDQPRVEPDNKNDVNLANPGELLLQKTIDQPIITDVVEETTLIKPKRKEKKPAQMVEKSVDEETASKIEVKTETTDVPAANNELIIMENDRTEPLQQQPIVTQVLIYSEPQLYGNTDTGAFAMMKKEFEAKDTVDKSEVSVKTSLDKYQQQQADLTPVLHIRTTIPLSPSISLRNATVYGVPKQTRYVTTIFEVTGSRLQMFLSDIEEELRLWTGRELVICCEVYWSQPATNSRNRQLEHSVRSAVNRPMISAKYQLAKRLQLHSVPNSITEECSTSGGSAVPGVEIGIYRQFTPKLVELINADTTQRHEEFWSFDPHQTPVEKLLKSHGAAEMRKNSILAVNLVTLEF